MAKQTIIQETCDLCLSVVDTTQEVIVQIIPGNPMKYDICLGCIKGVLTFHAGTPVKFSKGKATARQIPPSEEAAREMNEATKAKAPKQNQEWSQEDERFLTDNPLMSNADAADKLGRSFFAVRTRRSQLRNEGKLV